MYTGFSNDAETFSITASKLWMGPDAFAGSPEDPQSLNRYVYVRNDPENAVDPLGLYFVLIGNCLFRATDYFVDGVYGGTDLEFLECFGGDGGGGGGGGTPLGGGGIGGGEDQGGGGGVPIPPPRPNRGGQSLTPAQPPMACPVSARSLDNYLQTKNSPLAGQGNALFSAGQTHDVDPRFIVALAGAETGFGRNITRGQYNAWNWFYRGPSQRSHPFTSWQQGINSVTRGIAGRNYFQARPPLTTASAIYSRYCQGPDCVNGLRNLNTFLTQQGGNPNSLQFPCP